jgi:hypothetical protein
MPKPTVEALSVDYLNGIHTYLTKILKDNGLLLNDSILEQQKIAIILDSLAQIQT